MNTYSDVPHLHGDIAFTDLAQIKCHSWHYVFRPLIRPEDVDESMRELSLLFDQEIVLS